MQSLISIIVPAYNIAPYITRCLDSILHQSYESIEVIVINDGSTDNTGQIIDEYAGRNPGKVKCLHIPNGGVTNARLIGIANANGEWIGFVDGDDEIEQDMYERLVENAQKYNADISHCGYQTIVNNGERIHYFYNTGRCVVRDKITGLRDLLEGAFVEPGLCNKLFRKQLFDCIISTNAMNRDIKQNEDLLMNYLLFKEANIAVYEDFCPYHYLTRSDSATRANVSANKIFDPIKVMEWIFEDAVPEIRESAKCRYLKVLIGAYDLLCSCRGENEDTKVIRKKLLSLRGDWQLLNRNNRIKAELICWLPICYKMVINIYIKFFQKKIYE